MPPTSACASTACPPSPPSGGFGNWLPYPLGPLLFVKVANRFENKWQIVGSAMGVLAFIASSMLIVMITISWFGPRTRNLALENIAH